MRMRPRQGLGGGGVAPDELGQRFIISDSFGINLPTPRGWMAWLAMGGIEPSTACAAVRLLPTRPQKVKISSNFTSGSNGDKIWAVFAQWFYLIMHITIRSGRYL